MIIQQCTSALSNTQKQLLSQFMNAHGLSLEPDISYTVICYEGQDIIASGSISKNVLKCLLVDDAHRSTGLLTKIITELVSYAFRNGDTHLFAYTKPQNRIILASLGFFPIAETHSVLFMENRVQGFSQYLDAIAKPPGAGLTGAIVSNANPFTLGHLYLVEQAAADCEQLYLFILSEDRSEFPSCVRYELAKEATAHLPNVIVQESGPYIISAATMPTYFIKDTAAAQDASYELDISLFAKIAKKLNITRRYVGTEPYSPFTLGYNHYMKAHLPPLGVSVIELPRMEVNGVSVSAGNIRTLLREGRLQEVKNLVPPATYHYLVCAGQ